MSINFLILYCTLSFVNVVIQTVKSLCTVKCSTFVSACVNALAYGLYVYVIFFRDDEVVGAGVRLTNYGAIDEPISVTNISAVSEYDRYEVYFGRLSKGHNAPRISYLEY